MNNDKTWGTLNSNEGGSFDKENSHRHFVVNAKESLQISSFRNIKLHQKQTD